MALKHVVTGQRVQAEKLQRAKWLRRAMTEAEKRLWPFLRSNRLGGWHFRRQQVIDGWIVDFYCHAAGLVIELDGPVHESRVEDDQERDRVLEQKGLRVLRITNQEVFAGLEAVLQRIQQVCSENPKNLNQPPDSPV